MTIVHLELGGFYTEDTLYQTNLLARSNLVDGHKTAVVSTNFRWEGASLIKVPIGESVVEGGVHLIRLAFTNPDPHYTHQKIRKSRGVYPVLERLAPDVILSHGLQYWSILDVIRYKKDHPEIKLYADTHADYYTSGTNWLSRKVLNGMFYRWLVQKSLPFLEKLLYVTDECRRFSAELYGVPGDRMEFYPLGGTVLPEAEYQTLRTKRRAELGVGEHTPLLVHAGKLEPMKRTDALLRAFAAVPELDAKLAIIGSIPEEQKGFLTSLMDADSRVVYLGWKSGEELEEYLCACDLYCQPGKVSAIMQNAVCRNCPVLLYPHPDYVKDFDWGNIRWVRTEEDMAAAFRELAEGALPLSDMAEGSARCAREILDYRVLAARLYR